MQRLLRYILVSVLVAFLSFVTTEARSSLREGQDLSPDSAKTLKHCVSSSNCHAASKPETFIKKHTMNRALLNAINTSANVNNDNESRGALSLAFKLKF